MRKAFFLFSLSLSSCTSLTFVHDPETSFIPRSEVTGFLKSVRCELKTFYDANRLRSRSYNQGLDHAALLTAQAAKFPKGSPRNQQLLDEAAQVRDDVVRSFPHFTLSDALFGGVFLDLKVLDTVGIGATDVSVNYKQTLDATHSRTTTAIPTANTQNTYEMNLSFIIDQKQGISGVDSADGFECYNAGLLAGLSAERLASGDVPPGTELFTRIRVNAVTPLAGWLLQNAEQTWTNFVASNPNAMSEGIIPVQMNYSFTVQVTGGLDVHYSLVAPMWSPAQVGAGASSVQTSQMQFYLNGTDASLAAGAKVGTAVNLPAAASKAGTPGYVPGGLVDRQTAARLAEADRLSEKVAKILEEKGKSRTEQHSMLDREKTAIAPQVSDLLAQIKRLRQPIRRPAPPPTNGPLYRGYLLYPPALPNP